MKHEDLKRLAVHTITTKPWSYQEAVEHYSQAGINGITLWRNVFETVSPSRAGKMAADAGLEVLSVVRGGFFANSNQKKRQEAIDETRRCIEEAEAAGADHVVLVCGADPNQRLEISREQIAESMQQLLHDAKAAGVKLGVEPLHPMYADSRSAINTLAQANDLVEMINDQSVGVVVDVYHLWWDPDLQAQITRAAKGKPVLNAEERGHVGTILAFHICDWKTPTEDMLNDRGIMGEGCIPLKLIRTWLDEAGYSGFAEVEIFSNRYWNMDQEQYLENIITGYREHVL